MGKPNPRIVDPAFTVVARSETTMLVSVDTANERLSVSSADSNTVCEGGPEWAQGLLTRVGKLASTESSNVVELRDTPDGRKVCVSTTNLTVKLDIPGLLLPPFVPIGPFERTGSKSLQKLLDQDMGKVLGRFRDGYLKFASSPLPLS
jgi:hypothetical protein